MATTNEQPAFQHHHQAAAEHKLLEAVHQHDTGEHDLAKARQRHDSFIPNSTHCDGVVQE